MKLLLIEDDIIDRKKVYTQLKKHPEGKQWQILEADTLEASKKILKEQESISAILLDNNLPDGTAIDFLNYLEESEQNYPIVVATGQSEGEVAANLIKRGAHDYIDKKNLTSDIIVKSVIAAQKVFELHELEVQHKKDLKDFAARVAHDLRDPIGNIMSILELCLEDPDTEYLKKASDRATYAMDLLNNLLKFSMGQEIEPIHFDIGATLEEVTSLFRSKGHEFQLETQELPPINGDPKLIRLVFQNLISNSIKYRRDDTPLSIKIYTDGSHIVLEDNGLGFTDEQARNIFKPLHRLRQNKEEGHGLGLATCSRIIDQHGGFITARGIPGVGAKFFIFLPK